MHVRVLLFANLRDAAGCSEVELELPEPASVRTAAEELQRRLDAVQLRGVMCAVNERFAAPTTPVNEGDTIAFLPPVSGG